MKMIDANSAAFKAVGYDPATRTMRIHFHDAGIYEYSHVEQEDFDALMAAESKGTHLNQVMKNNHPYREITDPTGRRNTK
ncbi:KTSC domain-containing protein (plasmid) [Deinococcus wulumuqiensis]|uniref:KTSC domain-containing protein n=1 Tax=Deinococcus wulumuqiensis TaxID=980427 RepID=A0A345INC8_9DEIO|nr:KTSC domain-containing protein [Deinococcus wulumuqiensis]AXH01201.1 KTSC domain-containing protein [Deinococcus wulumuqiensis]